MKILEQRLKVSFLTSSAIDSFTVEINCDYR